MGKLTIVYTRDGPPVSDFELETRCMFGIAHMESESIQEVRVEVSSHYAIEMMRILIIEMDVDPSNFYVEVNGRTLQFDLAGQPLEFGEDSAWGEYIRTIPDIWRRYLKAAREKDVWRRRTALKME